MEDPKDLSTIPEKFFESDFYKYSTTLKDKEELTHFRCIVATFLNYYYDSVIEFSKHESDMNSLSETQRRLLMVDTNKKIKDLLTLAKENEKLMFNIVMDHIDMFKSNSTDSPNFIISIDNRSKIKTLLKQINREWAIEGHAEREQSFAPILDEIKILYPNSKGINVLVPGCGLGRLPFEIAKLGFNCQGNEFSYFMLFASNYIFNQSAHKQKIYPFLHKFTNNKYSVKNFIGVEIPDTQINVIPKDVEFSMVAGEFVDVYSKQDQNWDCVVTCFFIDTAKNVLEYLEIIHKILKKGGKWINLGPLLYHYSDQAGEISIELSEEELKYAIIKKGFKIDKECWTDCKYCSEPYEMLESIFKCWFFSATKSLD